MTQAALKNELPEDNNMLNEGNVQQFLTFMLGKEVYGLDILGIKEITGYNNLTPVPMMPSYIAGVYNLRGHVVPIINLRLRFGEEASDIDKRTSIVIIELKNDDFNMMIGIIVDAVNKVVDIPASEIEPPPSFGTQIRADFIKGMGRMEDGFLVLLDISNVLSIEELSAIKDMV